MDFVGRIVEAAQSVGRLQHDTMDGWTLALLASVPKSCDKA